MVQLIKLLGAAALLSSSTFAAPLARRQDAGVSGGEPVMPEESMPEEPMPQEPKPEHMPEEPVMPEEQMPEDPMPQEGQECHGDSCGSHAPPPMPTYGSGSSNWDSYADCVHQCMVQYGEPEPEKYTPPPQQRETENDSGGKIHYVMVQPVDGQPRYVPWAVNATVGDTVRFVWSSDVEHSVTMGSRLNLCAKSEAEGAFDSGLQSGKDGEQSFDVVVDNTDPQYFFCSAGDHCNKGMWGMINPPVQSGAANSIGSMMPEWAAANPDIEAAWSVIGDSTAGTPADTWGNNIILEGIPEDQYVNVATNTMYTRAFLAANPTMMETGLGAVNVDGSPIVIPDDVSGLIAQSANTNSDSEAPANAAESAPAPSTSSTSGAPSTVASAVGVSFVALLVTSFML